MTTKFTKTSLADWLNHLKGAGEHDEKFLIDWFKETENERFSIIGGWMSGYDPRDSDLFIMSKSDPTYALCVKISINNGPYAYTEFELMNMPYNSEGSVDDTCITLEHDTDSQGLAEWLMHEWERVSKEYADIDFSRD